MACGESGCSQSGKTLQFNLNQPVILQMGKLRPREMAICAVTPRESMAALRPKTLGDSRHSLSLGKAAVLI